MQRFISIPLPASERPKTFYQYYVTGVGTFPTDMLRHDAAWPASEDDAARLEGHERRSIGLHSYREPTIARWQSFLWSVGVEKL